MTLTLECPDLPLHCDSDGVVRVGQTRVTLATVVSAFKNGATAEQIAHDYSVLDLADIYAVIHFYLRRRQQVDSYLSEKRKQGEELREELEARYDSQGIRERLLARHKLGNGQDEIDWSEPMPTKQQIDSFVEFASSQMAGGGAALSMDEVYCLWRAKNPMPAELAESVDAVRAAYEELEAGDAGRPARDALRETCERLGLVLDE